MDVKQEVLESIRLQLPAADPDLVISEESVLAELGLTSLHLISLVLALQQQYGLEVDSLVEHGMPITVGDLVTLVQAEH
jgi:acyl carrier protein